MQSACGGGSVNPTPTPTPTTPGGEQLTRNFRLSEFRCNDGTDVPSHYWNNVKQLADNLQVLRDHFGASISITSGYRTPSHNAKVGGKSASQHLLAKAADIKVSGKTPSQVAAAIESLIASGKMLQGGLGRYSSFVHYDVRGYKARW
jgi:uncharacterized protein YcbK (DUF882 family)